MPSSTDYTMEVRCDQPRRRAMRTKAYYTGFSIGFAWAGQYATGTKSDRREIRRKLARMSENVGQFATGIFEGFTDRASQRAEAIKAGLAPRTINPHKPARVADRVA